MKKLNELIDEIEEKVAKHIGEGVTHNRSKRIKQRTNALAYGKFGTTLRQCTKKQVLSIHKYLDLEVEEEEEVDIIAGIENPYDVLERTRDRTPMTASMREKVMEKSNYRCAECNDPLNSDRDGNTAIDHIKPKCFYGEDTIDNLRALCKTCHKCRNINPSYRHKMKIMAGLRTAAGMWAGHSEMGLYNAAQLIWDSHHNTYQTKEEVILVVNDMLDKVLDIVKENPPCGRCGVFESCHSMEVDGHEFLEVENREDKIRKEMGLTVS
jgi:hypothetical protein